jgi:hypothetical protein
MAGRHAAAFLARRAPRPRPALGQILRLLRRHLTRRCDMTPLSREGAPRIGADAQRHRAARQHEEGN